MSRPQRIKPCHICNKEASILYRVKYQEEGDWIFVCPECWQTISQDNPYYTYGGTWKAQKKK